MKHKITNYQSGHKAEIVAAEYLVAKGYKVIELNWKTPVCEIDIIATLKNVMYFVEVKFRRTTNQGGGLEYITDKKIAQMQYAARCWVQAHKYSGDYELGALEVSGENYQVTDFLPHIL